MKNVHFLWLSILLLTHCKKNPVLPQIPEAKIIIDAIDLSNVNFNTKFAVWDMKLDSKDRIWLGTSNGLIMYDQQSKVWTRFSESNFPPPMGFSIFYTVYHFEIDKNDNIYVRVDDVNDQLYIFDGTAWRIDKMPGFISFLKMDNVNNVLWVGTSAGLLSIKNGQKTLYDKSNSILKTNPSPNEHTYSIHKIGSSSNGHVWFGSDGDLIQFDGVHWQRYVNATLPNQGFITLYVNMDNTGIPFIGINEICYSFDGQNVIQNLTDSLKKYQTGLIQDFYFHPETNNMFFQTGNDVLYHNRDKKTFVALNNVSSNLPNSNSFSVIAFDSKGNTWVAKSSFVGKLPVSFK